MKNAEHLIQHGEFLTNRLAPVVLLILPMVAGAAFVAAYVLSGIPAIIVLVMGLLFTMIAWTIAKDTVESYLLERITGNFADQFSVLEVEHYKTQLEQASAKHGFTYNKFEQTTEQFVEDQFKALLK